ncbi:hypothetical protein B0A53_05083 [Rhodotorula sp. CCFEE 5036]|nr:hypothetical protein B0A53_05083 [Rhodotorula sp. CCFEE 5036]
MEPYVLVINGWPHEPISSPRIAFAAAACGAGAAGWLPLRSAPLLFFVVANAPAAEEAMRWLRSAVTVNHDPPILLLPGIHGGWRLFLQVASDLMALPAASYKTVNTLFDQIIQIFSEGQLFPASVLDVSEDELVGRFMQGVQTIAAISLAISYPTLASVTHSLVNTYKRVLAVALETDYTFPEVEALKDRLANPEAYAAAAPAADAGAAAGGAAAKEEKPAEEEEESDDDLGFGLFD